MKIVWTDSAKTDLIDIRDFLRSSESVQFAAKVTKEIRDEVATLKKWPKHKGTYGRSRSHQTNASICAATSHRIECRGAVQGRARRAQ